MKSPRVRRFLLAAVGLLALLWFRKDLTVALGLLRDRLTLTTAVGIGLFTLVHFGNEPMRWWLFLRRDYPRATLVRTWHLLNVTALASYLFPARLGMPIRMLMSKRVLQLDYPTTSALLLLDSLLTYGLWSLTAIVGVVVLFPGSRLIAPAAGILLATVGLSTLLFVVYRRPINGIGVSARFRTALGLFSARVLTCNALLIAIDIFTFGARHALILVGLGVHIPLLPVTLAVAISIMAGFASLMPLGLGAYDLSIALLLTTLGVPREAAVAVPIIDRIVTISIGCLLGSVSAAHLGVKSRADLATAALGTPEKL